MFDFFGLIIIMIRVVAGPFKFLFIFCKCQNHYLGLLVPIIAIYIYIMLVRHEIK